MPELVEQMYCSQQIVIPPKYPYVLKRFCKAAIKTQPYDLLRWSFEYFRALAEHRPPPVKLRLEYPVYSTEGGLTRGCLKVLGHQLFGMNEIPTSILYQAWQGFCLDLNELRRILCLCEVYLREESVPYLHFMAVAGGMLTKCLTHTMILLCESLTKEPDGGSAAIPVQDFVTMYEYLARIDASRDVKYLNGFREGYTPPAEEGGEEEGTEGPSDAGGESHAGHLVNLEFDDEDDYWGDRNVQRLSLIDDAVARTPRVSVKLNMPLIGKIERSPSIERAGEIERDNYMRERKGRPVPNEEIDKKLQQLSAAKLGQDPTSKEDQRSKDFKEFKDFKDFKNFKDTEDVVIEKKVVEIFVFDEVNKPTTYEIFGEPRVDEELLEEMTFGGLKSAELKDDEPDGLLQPGHSEETDLYLAEMYATRDERMNDIEQTFDDIAAIVDKYQTANYDLGMVAGRQMSTTSGEFIVHHIEKEIMDYIDEQIAILPDPNLKKKKAKPEEVAMIRDILEQFLDDNMDVIAPEIEEVEEEEAPIPEIITVYAVPGIGGPVDADIVSDFVDYSNEVCKTQGDLIMPRNIRHFMCPPLEKYVEINYDVMEPQKEEVATAGAITE